MIDHSWWLLFNL